MWSDYFWGLLKENMSLVYTYPMLACVAGLCCQTLVAQSPDVKIEVNKEFDEQGNVIRYDSAYSYTYEFANPGEAGFFDSLFRQFGFFSQPGSFSPPRTHMQEVVPPSVMIEPAETFRELMQLQRQFMEEIMHDPPCRRQQQKPCCPGNMPIPSKVYPGQKSTL